MSSVNTCCGNAVALDQCRTCGTKRGKRGGPLYGHQDGTCWPCHDATHHRPSPSTIAKYERLERSVQRDIDVMARHPGFMPKR